MVDALWGSGLAWAQAAALQLFDQALRWAGGLLGDGGWVVKGIRWVGGNRKALGAEQEGKPTRAHQSHPQRLAHPAARPPGRPPACSAGWLLPAEASPCRGLLKLDLRAQHAGTAQLRMRRWLLDLRRSIGNSSTPSILNETKRVCVLGASAADAAAGGMAGAGAADAAAVAARVKGELGASLVAHGAPFRVSAEGGRAQRLESSSAMVRKWLFSGGRSRASFFSAAAAGCRGGGGQGVAACVPTTVPALHSRLLTLLLTSAPCAPLNPSASEAFDDWDSAFCGRAAAEATGAAAADLEACLRFDAGLESDAAQVRAGAWAGLKACGGHSAGTLGQAGVRACGLPRDARAAAPAHCATLASPQQLHPTWLAAAPPVLTSQAWAQVRAYEPAHALDADALRLDGYPERRRKLVAAAHHLASRLGVGATAQLWHAGELPALLQGRH